MRYRLQKTTPRLSSMKEIVETRDGDVACLVAINGQPRTDLLFEMQPFMLDARDQLFQVRRSGFIDAQFAVCGEARIHLISETCQFSLATAAKSTQRSRMPRAAQ